MSEEDFDFLFNRGCALLTSGQGMAAWLEALPIFLRANSIAEEDGDLKRIVMSSSRLAGVYSILRDSESALKHFHRCIDLEPDSGRHHLMLGEYLRYLGRDQEGMTHLKAAAALGNEDARLELGGDSSLG